MPVLPLNLISLWRRVPLAGGLALVLTAALRAHDPGISTAQGLWHNGRIEITTGFAPADIEQLLPPAWTRQERWSQAEFDAARPLLLALAPELWEVRAGDTPLTPREVQVQLLPGDNVSFRHVFAPPADAGRVLLRAPRLTNLPEGHRQFLVFTDESGFVTAKKLLSARDATLVLSRPERGPPGEGGPAAGLPAPSPSTPTILAFIHLGVEHIWTGYDHLLFLFALLLVCRGFRSIGAVVTCFTLAHSLTLALATLDWVRVSPRLVEPMIAASIVFVGAENLIKRGEEPRGRWALTFGFGLVHGFGFASVLRDLGVGQGGQGVLLPLFSFNAGVELGQIAVAAVVLPLVWWLRRWEKFVRYGIPALSVAVTLAGLYWLVQRTLLA